MSTRQRILGIGLPRTGTQSLAVALRLLGFATLHAPISLAAIAAAGVQAATEVPYPLDRLERWFPGSLYVLTLREPEVWRASLRRTLPRVDATWRHPLWHTPPGSWRRQCRDRYREAVKTVAGSGRLLTYCLTAGAGWEPLCCFLKVPIPDVPFPNIDMFRGHS